MKLLLGAIALLLLAGAPAQAQVQLAQSRPAIQQLTIDNRGKDDVIVVFSRSSASKPFLHASRLPPGSDDNVRVPDLSTLVATVLRRSDVKRAQLAGNGGDDRKHGGKDNGMALLGLGLALAKSGDHKKEGGHEDDEHGDREEHEQRDEHEEREQPQQQDDHYGRPPDEPRDENPSGLHLALGSAAAAQQDHGHADSTPPAQSPPPDAKVEIKATDGDGTRVVNGVAITVHTGQAPPESSEPFDEYGRPRDAGGRDVNPGSMHVVDSNYLGVHTVEDKTAQFPQTEPRPKPAPAAAPGKVMSVAPAPVNSGTTNVVSTPCYCGPDMTAAYIAALKRALDRIRELPNSETGPWDGIWFLSNNAGSMDERVRPARMPGPPAGGDGEAAMLCPSGPCADLPGAGAGTMSLFGVCLPQHVGNDIMYGYVATLLGVPGPIQNAGGHWAQLNSTYSSFDPPQSQAAYAIGQSIAELEDGGEFNPETVGEKFKEAPFVTGTVVTPARFYNAVDFIRQTYPALADCPRCPNDASEPGTMLRDWTMSTWTLSDGSRNYAPGEAPGD